MTASYLSSYLSINIVYKIFQKIQFIGYGPLVNTVRTYRLVPLYFNSLMPPCQVFPQYAFARFLITLSFGWVKNGPFDVLTNHLKFHIRQITYIPLPITLNIDIRRQKYCRKGRINTTNHLILRIALSFLILIVHPGPLYR